MTDPTQNSRRFEVELLRSTFGIVRTHARSFFAFGLLFGLFVLWFAGPAVAWLIRQLYRSSGDAAVSNADIISFILTPPGMAAVVLGIVATLAETSARRAGFIIISSGAVGHEAGAAFLGLWAMIKRLPRLALTAALQLSIALLAVLPLMVMGYLAYRKWMFGYDLSYFIHARPPGYVEMQWAAIVLSVLLVALLVWLYLRWIFVVPLAITTSCRPREALRQSARMGRGFRRYLLRALALAALVVWITSLVLKWIGERGMDLVISMFPDSLTLASWLAAALIAVGVLLGVIVSLLLLAGEAAMVASLYDMRRPDSGSAAHVRQAPEARFWRSVQSPKVRRRLIWLVVLTIAVASLGSSWAALNEADLHARPQVMAHRGGSAAPENTLSAIRHAVETGAGWVEIDVQLTADSQVVLFHDRDLMRMCGDPARIGDLSLEQLSHYDVGGWFSPEFAGERIPRLEQVIAAVQDRAGLNIELKYVDPDAVLIQRVIQTIRETRFREHCVITSFTYSQLQTVRQIDSSLRTGLIVAAALGDISDLDVSMLNIEQYSITRRDVRAAHAHGLEVISGTVDDPRQMEALIHLGVDYVMTNRPDILVDLLAARDELTALQLLTLNVRNLLGKG